VWRKLSLAPEKIRAIDGLRASSEAERLALSLEAGESGSV
jgi:hypothetical protein